MLLSKLPTRKSAATLPLAMVIPHRGRSINLSILFSVTVDCVFAIGRLMDGTGLCVILRIRQLYTLPIIR